MQYRYDKFIAISYLQTTVEPNDRKEIVHHMRKVLLIISTLLYSTSSFACSCLDFDLEHAVREIVFSGYA